ncbi:DUF503 domain-containing protein [Mahella sp.]|uniref:DUF503 domain-containing protein n=1 Tax=Mahella sp. TaxID=2798721 RepID=UPI0025BD8E28|nr:DUF503 domain-containing protein [Mahella sp.]
MAVAMIEISIPFAHSLKDKRHVVKGITARLRNRFNVSVAEMEYMDIWQRAVLGIACISNNGKVANGEIDKAIDYIESGEGEYLVINIEVQIL